MGGRGVNPPSSGSDPGGGGKAPLPHGFLQGSKESLVGEVAPAGPVDEALVLHASSPFIPNVCVLHWFSRSISVSVASLSL